MKYKKPLKFQPCLNADPYEITSVTHMLKCDIIVNKTGIYY